MGREELAQLWSELLEGPLPKRISQPLVRRMLAFELQARQHGGLTAATRRKLQTAAAGRESTSSTPGLKPGGRLLREWNGVTHVVDVVEGGFLWHGERHRSLSAIARAITGAHWSGPRFFGLQEYAARTSAAKGRAGGTRPARSSSAPRHGSASAGTAPVAAAAIS